MNDTKLKDCPFCGAKPEMIFKGNNHTAKRAVTIKCPQCRCQRTDAGITSPLTTLVRVAVEHWNARHAEAKEFISRDEERNNRRVFIGALDRAIKFHKNNANDPHNVSNAVIASLSEVRDAFNAYMTV